MSESYDLFGRMSETTTGRLLLEQYEDRWAAAARAVTGTARQCTWEAEDGWLITYTTTRVKGGPHDGKFVVQAHKPTGKGARSGKATMFVETYRRQLSTRKGAKARAETIYRQHSPKYAARYPEEGS